MDLRFSCVVCISSLTLFFEFSIRRLTIVCLKNIHFVYNLGMLFSFWVLYDIILENTSKWNYWVIWFYLWVIWFYFMFICYFKSNHITWVSSEYVNRKKNITHFLCWTLLYPIYVSPVSFTLFMFNSNLTENLSHFLLVR